MQKVITQNKTKFLLFLPFLSILLVCCHSGQKNTDGSTHLAQLQKTTMLLPSGKGLEIFLALRNSEQVQGLSNLRPDQLKDDQGMLFYYFAPGIRRFWMPDTYFDLDLFFINEQMVVTDIVRNLKAHPGRQEPPPIATTPPIEAFHVLELKSGSPAAQELQIGHKITWPKAPSQSEIQSYIRQGQ